ncbi:MAG: ABC transporter substrate-binding protein/permease, partial [Mogibacterium sp.]|nr:ABC transporter substrate-binding protein/permease [Mogibacterium sp.]
KAFLKCTKIAAAAAVMTAALLLCACAKGDDDITSLDQLDEKGNVVAIATSTPEANKVMKEFKQAEFVSYTDIFPAYQEVSTGKVDACISQRIQMERAIEHGVSGVRILDETYCDNTVAIAVSRKTEIPDLRDKINQFLNEKKEDGTLDDMYQRWAVDENYVMPDIPPAEDPQYAVTVATTGTIEPWSFYAGTGLSGYDIELAKRFASWLGAGLQLKVYDFGGVISAAQSGDADCVMSNLYYMPEYEEALDFSDPIMTVEVTAMVKDHGSAKNEEGFLPYIKNSFKRTFLAEDRWQLFVSGAVTTLIITAASIVLGALLGFILYNMSRSGGRAADALTRFTVWLVQGMPAVVLLMLLYYVVFGSVTIPGTVVSVMGFTLIFGATVYQRLKEGIAAIDIGQTRAAYALGYSDRKAFFRIVLPQAMPFILVPLRGDMGALLRATAVVGYIAVQDLTKMADIVRSRTYDALFPLISIAVIYFILEAVLNLIADRVEPMVDPKRRKREDILKGVKRR